MTKPVFLLGVGCQKGGTTWLYDYLSRHPEAQLARPKELHVFDTMLRPDLYLRYYFNCLAQDRDWRKPWQRWRRPDPAYASPSERIAMMNDPAAYVRYFRKIAARGLTGEICPSYAVLDAENFRYIRSILEPHFHVKVVFLMRDPVERTRSALRMRLRSDHQLVGRHLEPTEADWFRRLFDKTMYLEQSRYDKTIAALDAAFDPADILYGFYETLFEPAMIERICTFLGIAPVAPDFARTPNATARGEDLPADLIARARAEYDPAYALCAARFGEEFIAAIWPHYRRPAG